VSISFRDILAGTEIINRPDSRQAATDLVRFFDRLISITSEESFGANSN
jgi:hypothetical protein